ncbi:Outer membrane protein beta-barrel domain-containing protein [Hymenobacter daecheongensis DSM 21074]|uniref:Outer membrane protein beta-barrel domain-containing protein n=1 Tax=Hymenobacter daecheongensis DSM 21074 TaxID=1121955 RepID=A0A1M6A0C5_9BACT|nr:porin family protein [Hymenobacter daecheongensis]SHI29613.1 Outer membrane protein beta-barrel domain-containing protein [Hymenobacter daecheongensis DSM 21074]
MKKIAVLALSLLSVSAAKAQDAGGFRIGVKAGATYSTVNGRDSEKLFNNGQDNKLGFNAGLAFTIPLTSDGFASFAPEILLNRKGYEAKSQTTTGLPAGVSKVENEYKRTLTYIEVPLLAKINAGGLFFELGPQVGYMARSSQDQQTITKFTNGDKDKVNDNTSDGKEDLASFDIGGIAGVGYQTESGLSIGVRYNQGFKTLFDTKNVNGKDEDRAFNTAYMLQIGYLLPLGK